MALEALACSNCGARLRVANTRLLTCEFCSLSVVNPGYTPEAATAPAPAAHAPTPSAAPAHAPPAAAAPAAAAPVATAPAASRSVPRTTEELVSFIRGFLKLNDSLYYAPGVPPTKEANARKAYGAAVPASETILALYDGTVFGAGDDGFILTPSLLAWNSFGIQVVPWRDIDPAAVQVVDDHVAVMGQQIPYSPDGMVDGMARLFREIASMARAPAAAPASAPAKVPVEKVPAKSAAVPAPAPAPAKPQGPSGPSASSQWFVAIDGAQKGPMGMADLKQLVSQGHITGETFVWCQEMTEWQPMSGVAYLSSLASAGAAKIPSAPAKGPGLGPKGPGVPAKGPGAVAKVLGPSNPRKGLVKPMNQEVEEESDETEWYLQVDDEEDGPYSLDDMVQMFADGDIDAETLVWCEGMDDWDALENVDELVEVCSAKRGGPGPKKGGPSGGSSKLRKW